MQGRINGGIYLSAAVYRRKGIVFLHFIETCYFRVTYAFNLADAFAAVNDVIIHTEHIIPQNTLTATRRL